MSQIHWWRWRLAQLPIRLWYVRMCNSSIMQVNWFSQAWDLTVSQLHRLMKCIFICIIWRLQPIRSLTAGVCVWRFHQCTLSPCITANWAVCKSRLVSEEDVFCTNLSLFPANGPHFHPPIKMGALWNSCLLKASPTSRVICCSTVTVDFVKKKKLW